MVKADGGEEEEETEANKDGKKVEDTENNGDGYSYPFSSAQKEAAKKTKKPKVPPVMMPDSVYSANKSLSGHPANKIAFPLSYGSADLQGFKFLDTVCLNPLITNSTVTDKDLRENFCIKDFKY